MRRGRTVSASVGRACAAASPHASVTRAAASETERGEIMKPPAEFRWLVFPKHDQWVRTCGGSRRQVAGNGPHQHEDHGDASIDSRIRRADFIEKRTYE